MTVFKPQPVDYYYDHDKAHAVTVNFSQVFVNK